MSKHVAILGSGVIGLSTALALLEDQCGGTTLVTIVAKEVPDLAGFDVAGVEHGGQPRYSAAYASAWAGGHHVSDAKSARELAHDKVTFERMAKLIRERPWAASSCSRPEYPDAPLLPVAQKPNASNRQDEPEPLVWVHQTELFQHTESFKAHSKAPYQGVLDWYPDFRPLPRSSLAQDIEWGCTFSTIDINVPVYHRWLLRRVLELGARLIVAETKSLSEAVQLASNSECAKGICRNPRLWVSVGKPRALVVSPGLGARTIGGINDDAVHPERGQVVVVNAPWLSTSALPSYLPKPKHNLPGYSIVCPQGGREVYVIPRGDGTVICGGTRIVDDWDPMPRPETTRKILARCLELVPDLIKPNKRTGLTKARVEDIEVVGVNVGLRPARRGGVRLERGEEVEGVKVIWNYGYGGAGYQASWGAALECKQLVEEALGQASSSPLSSKL